MEKRIVSFMLLVCIVLWNIIPIQVMASVTSTNNSVTVNNQTRNYNNVYHISTTGSDETGDGSKSNPFASFYKAKQVAKAGDCIFFEKGEFIFKKPVINDGTWVVTYFAPGYVDVIGSGKDTILILDNTAFTGNTSRDAPIFLSVHGLVSNLHVKFKQRNSGANYSRSLICNSLGEINNVYFENIGTAKVSYSYYGMGSGLGDNKAVIKNSIFNIGSADVDYNGNLRFENSIFSSTPSRGTKLNSKTRAIVDTDLSQDNLTADLLNAGNGFNPDGSIAHIGVYGGLYAWNDKPELTTQSALKVLLKVEEEVQLSVTNGLTDNLELTWTSTNNNVITVDEYGRVTAIAEGTADIWARNDEGYEEYISIIVVGKEEIKELRLSVYLNQGESARFYMTEDNSNVTWSSLDTNVAIVNSNGRITAISEGLAIITAEYEGNIETIYVRVVE